jgi:hypothetical protein
MYKDIHTIYGRRNSNGLAFLFTKFAKVLTCYDEMEE